MGAHLSTIQNTLRERFQKCDAEAKGSLVSARPGACVLLVVLANKDIGLTPTRHMVQRNRLCCPQSMAVQTLGQMMAMQPQFGISCCHVGVLFLIDRWAAASCRFLVCTW